MGEYSIGQALKYFLDKSKLKNNVRAFEITDVWEKIMGKTIAKYTEKIHIFNRTLFITTSVAPLKNELLFQKEKIIQRVNEAMGENLINDVVIQ
jgi:predicted nucleic acid-binding Zn ribbon protein